MSVIPWIFNQKSGTEHADTVVCDDQDFKFEGEAILVKEFKTEEFDNPKTTNISYDLHVGKEYFLLGEPTKKPLSKDQLITLTPGASVIVRVMEEVHLPRRRFGQIVSRASLLQKGLANWVTKVDPGYSGPLFVTVYNFGPDTQKLKYNEEFCALYILDTSHEGVRPYGGPSKSFEGEYDKNVYQIILDGFIANLPLISAFSTLAVLASIALGIVNLVKG